MGIFRFIRNIFAFPGNIAAMANAARRSEEALHMLHTLHGESHAARLEQRDLFRIHIDAMRSAVIEQNKLLQTMFTTLHENGTKQNDAVVELEKMVRQGAMMHEEITRLTRSMDLLAEHTQPLQVLPYIRDLMTRLPIIEDRAVDMVRNLAHSVTFLQSINDRVSDTAIHTGVTKDMVTAMETHASNIRNVTQDIHRTAFHMAIESERERLLALPKYQDAKRLNRYEKQICSQNGEDGCIEEIFKRIGVTDKRFVEFGVSNGLESNTTYLLQKDWKGLWVEANEQFCASIRKLFRDEIGTHTLTLMERFLTAENVVNILREAGIPETFDLLSVDIDGNDFWIWKALDCFRPRVVVIEYNAHFPPDMHWILHYEPTFRWDGTQYYGASLAALTALAEGKGYKLVGCELTGNNAFFVREELSEWFRDPFTSLNHYEPPRYYMVHKRGHRHGFGPRQKSQ